MNYSINYLSVITNSIYTGAYYIIENSIFIINNSPSTSKFAYLMKHYEDIKTVKEGASGR
jgi:hypothetical protein